MLTEHKANAKGGGVSKFTVGAAFYHMIRTRAPKL